MVNDYNEKLQREVWDERWINAIIEKGSYCMLCGVILDPWLLERHHIAGRRCDGTTISVCPTCHKELSRKQYSWDRRWTSDENDDQISLGFFLQGISDVMMIISQRSKERANILLEEDT